MKADNFTMNLTCLANKTNVVKILLCGRGDEDKSAGKKKLRHETRTIEIKQETH